ncbi:MAG: CNNM domain-containing protein [candidate division WOR-3 bacterium]
MQEGLWVLVKVVLLIVFLALSFIISGSEVAYFSGHSPSNLAYRRTFGLLITILVLNNISNSFISGLTSEIIPISGVVISLILTVVITLIGELLPKRLALTYPKPFISLTHWMYDILTLPFYWVKLRFHRATVRITKHVLIDSFADILYHSEISKDERILLAKTIYAIHSRGYAVMIPLSGITMLKAETPVSVAREELEGYPYEFVPIYFFTSDEIMGFVKFEDILSFPEDIPVMDLPLKKPKFVPIMVRFPIILDEIEKEGIIGLVDEYGTLRGFACKKSVENWLIHDDNRLPLNISLMEVFLLTGKEIGPMDWDIADLFQYSLGRPVQEGDSLDVEGIRLLYKENVVYIIPLQKWRL